MDIAWVIALLCQPSRIYSRVRSKVPWMLSTHHLSNTILRTPILIIRGGKTTQFFLGRVRIIKVHLRVNMGTLTKPKQMLETMAKLLPHTIIDKFEGKDPMHHHHHNLMPQKGCHPIQAHTNLPTSELWGHCWSFHAKPTNHQCSNCLKLYGQ